MFRLSEVKLKVLTVVTLSSVLATAGLSLVKAVDSKDVTFVTEKSSGDAGVNRGVNTDKEITSNVLKDINQKESTDVNPKDEIRGGQLSSTEGNLSVSNESSSIMFKEVEKEPEVGESQGDFSVSLVNVPADGYGYDDSAKASIRINNTTGKDLSNLVVKFKIKKKLIDAYGSDLDGIDPSVVFSFGGGSFLWNYSSDIVKSLNAMRVIRKDDPYIYNKLLMRTVTVGKRIDTTVDLRIDFLKFRTMGIYVPSSDYLSNRNFDIEYEILEGSQVLGRGSLPIRTKAPDLITSQRNFRLDLTRVGRTGETFGANFNRFTDGGSVSNVFTIVDDNDKKFWLVVKDKENKRGLYQYVENSKFKFKIPQGFNLDEESLRRYYPGMRYSKLNDTVEVDVRPGDVGLNIGYNGRSVERGFKVTSVGYENIYFSLPLIKSDEKFDTYNFSVDTSGGAFSSVTDLTLDAKKTFSIKSELDLIETNMSYVGSVRPGVKYIYDDDYLRLPDGYTYNLNSLEYDTKVNGANMKALVFSPNFFQNAKIYGLRSDGSRVVLDAQSFNSYDHILGEYFKTQPLINNSQNVVHVPDDVVKLRFEFDKKITTGDYFANRPVWEITDKDAVITKNNGGIRLGVNGTIKEYPYNFFINSNLEYNYGWDLKDVSFVNTLRATQYFNGSDYLNLGLLSVDTSHLRKHVILKVPKEVSAEIGGSYAIAGSFYDIVGEEVHGDTKYILISQKEGVQLSTPYLATLLNISPTLLDGVYNTSSRVYLEGKDSLPDWLKVRPHASGGQEYSFQYDPTRSIRDNYERVTDGTEARAKITVEKPKVLSTTTTVNDVTNVKVKSFDTIFNVKSYVTNNSSDPVLHPVLDVVIPDKLELAKAVVVPSGYKVQYQLDGSNNYVDNVSDFSKVRKYRVVANDSNSSILPNTSLIVEAPMKLKRNITGDVNEVLKTTVTHGGGTLISDVVNVTSDLQEFKDGVVNVKWVDDKGVTLKTQKLTGRHGTKYVVDRAMFTKDGKYYKYVSVEGTPEGTYTGGVTSDVVVHMKEQEITFELPMTGTIGTLGVLGSLLSALGVTFARKRGR